MKSNSLDVARYVFISPEIVAFFTPLVLWMYIPSWADIFVKEMKIGLTFGLGSIAITVGALAFNYKESHELLLLSGSKKMLLDWPGYQGFKGRIYASFVWCVFGGVACAVGTWMALNNIYSGFAASLLSSGVLASLVTAACIGLARFPLRETFIE